MGSPIAESGQDDYAIGQDWDQSDDLWRWLGLLGFQSAPLMMCALIDESANGCFLIGTTIILPPADCLGSGHIRILQKIDQFLYRTNLINIG